MITPTVPITPAQEAALLNLFANLQLAVTAYFNNPTPATQLQLKNELNLLYNFLLNEFPTPAGRNATRFSLFLLLATVNQLQGVAQIGKISNMMQSLYNALSIFVAELLTSSPAVKNQLLNTLTFTVTITSDVPSGSPGPTGPAGAQGFGRTRCTRSGWIYRTTRVARACRDSRCERRTRYARSTRIAGAWGATRKCGTRGR
ncbi:collagen-like repeat preface domain-containing protein [Bacillus sp. FSL K6-0268]